MTPADIARHTADVREMIKDAEYRKVQSSLDPYSAKGAEKKAPSSKPTFVWPWIWTPESKQHKDQWENLVKGFKIALGTCYPDHRVAHMELECQSKDYIAMLVAQIYAKQRRLIRGNLIYIEADVVCNRPCDPFESDFDIGLTDSSFEWPLMPFNPGVMFARDTVGAQRFLDTAMQYACHIPQGMPLWYAYQLAVPCAYTALKDEIDIKIFPRAMYNYTPEVYAPTDAYFVHLKGARKANQSDYIKPMLAMQAGMKRTAGGLEVPA